VPQVRAVSVMRGASFASLTVPGAGAVELHAADAQQRQDRHRQHDDAHAAEPAQRVAPQVDASAAA
jgi:hypothetical protein